MHVAAMRGARPRRGFERQREVLGPRQRVAEVDRPPNAPPLMTAQNSRHTAEAGGASPCSIVSRGQKASLKTWKSACGCGALSSAGCCCDAPAAGGSRQLGGASRGRSRRPAGDRGKKGRAHSPSRMDKKRWAVMKQGKGGHRALSRLGSPPA